MLTIKRMVTVVVMVYLLLALLFILAPSTSLLYMGFGEGLTSQEQKLDGERHFFYLLSIVGAVILTLQLLIENLDSVLLRRTVIKKEGKINELKAKLYDTQQRTTAPVIPGSRTIDGRVPVPPAPERPVASSSTENRTADHLPQPTFPQSDPSLSNTPPADRPAL